MFCSDFRNKPEYINDSLFFVIIVLGCPCSWLSLFWCWLCPLKLDVSLLESPQPKGRHSYPPLGTCSILHGLGFYKNPILYTALARRSLQFMTLEGSSTPAKCTRVLVLHLSERTKHAVHSLGIRGDVSLGYFTFLHSTINSDPCFTHFNTSFHCFIWKFPKSPCLDSTTGHWHESRMSYLKWSDQKKPDQGAVNVEPSRTRVITWRIYVHIVYAKNPLPVENCKE